MTVKERLHRLVEELPDDEAAGLLRSLLEGDGASHAAAASVGAQGPPAEDMVSTENGIKTLDGAGLIVRTERGLSLAGTRITLYDIMDYIKAGWPAHLIRNWLNLTDEQIAAVMEYIDSHRAEVEAEYAQVLEYAEENRRYWEERNRERFAEIAAMPPRPGQEAIRAKLEAYKSKLAEVG